MNSEIKPANPETFKKELDAIRFPTPEKQPRKPFCSLAPFLNKFVCLKALIRTFHISFLSTK